MQEVVAPSVHFPSRRHAGHRTHIEVVELNAAFGESLEVGSLDPFIAVGGHEVAAEGVVHDDDAAFFHGGCLLGVWSYAKRPL